MNKTNITNLDSYVGKCFFDKESYFYYKIIDVNYERNELKCIVACDMSSLLGEEENIPSIEVDYLNVEEITENFQEITENEFQEKFKKVHDFIVKKNKTQVFYVGFDEKQENKK